MPKRTANHLLRLTAHGLKPHMPSLVLTCVPTHVPVAIGEGNCGAAPQGEAATISNNVRASRTSRIRFGGLPLQGVARPQMVLPGATLWGDASCSRTSTTISACRDKCVCRHCIMSAAHLSSKPAQLNTIGTKTVVQRSFLLAQSLLHRSNRCEP